MAACYDCSNTEILERAILQAWIDLMTYSDAGFPQTKDAIVALAPSGFFNLSNAEYFTAYRGYLALAALGDDPGFDCTDVVFFQGGDQKLRATVLQDIVDVILGIDGGYDTSMANLTRVACNVCMSQSAVRGCIMYCVAEYCESLAPGTTFEDALQAGCCCPGTAGEESYYGIVLVERAPSGFPGPPVGATWPTILNTGLLLRLESDDFDGYANLQQISSWVDKSGNVNDMGSQGAGYDPWADQVITLNGHATVRFTTSTLVRHLRRTAAWNGDPGTWSQAEIMVIQKVDNDPALGSLGAWGKFGNSSGNDSHVPLNDGNIYENFGDANRPNSGNPTTSLANWHGYNVRAANTNIRSIVIGSEFLEAATGGHLWTIPRPGSAVSVGNSWVGNYTPPTYAHRSLDGNIAAVYFWYIQLGGAGAPRTALRDYIQAKWGVTVSAS